MNNLFKYGCSDYGIVAMDDGSQEFVKNIKKGDNVVGGVVECIVRIKPSNNPIKFYKTSSDLLINEYHPIKINNKFVLPKDIFDFEFFDSEYIYLFLLEKKIDDTVVIKTDSCNPLFNCNNKSVEMKRPNTIVINNTEVITIANSIYDDLFSSEKIINTLKKCKGWSNGLITFIDNEKLFVINKKKEVTDINIIYEL